MKKATLQAYERALEELKIKTETQRGFVGANTQKLAEWKEKVAAYRGGLGSNPNPNPNPSPNQVADCQGGLGSNPNPNPNPNQVADYQGGMDCALPVFPVGAKST